MNTKADKHPIARVAGIGMAILVILFLAHIVTGWTGPTAAPPNGNVSAPVNISDVSQTKDGSLGVGGLAVFGNTILYGVSRYLNFGTVSGEPGYGIRDSAGVMQFKNESGNWRSLDSIIADYLSANGFYASSSSSTSSGTSGGFTTTVFVDNTAGASTKTYACPTGQYVLSATQLSVPAGDFSCDTPVASDKRTVSYNQCNVISGQTWRTRVICGGGSSSSGGGGARASDFTRITAEIRGTSLPDCSGDQSGAYFCGYGPVTTCPAGKKLVDYNLYNSRGGGDMAGHDFQYSSCEKSGEGVRAYILVGERNANYVTQCSGLCVPE